MSLWRLWHDSAWMKMDANNTISDKCRLCLADGDKIDLTPIFDENNDPGLSLAARIMVCLSIPVQSRDPLPCSICNICKNRVTQFYAFREICYDSYYSLLGHRVSNRANGFFKDAEKEEGVRGINSLDLNGDFKQERAEETQLYFGQDVHRSMHLGRNNQLTDGDITLETYLQESNVEEVSVENLLSNSIADEATSANIELNNLRCTSSCQTEEKQTYREKVLIDDHVKSEEKIHDIKYKCLQCDCIFSDFDSASIHCAECSSLKEEEEDSNATAEQADSMEYQDDDLQEHVEAAEEIEEADEQPLRSPAKESSLTNATRQRKSVLSYRNENSRVSRTKSSSIARKRKLRKKNSQSCKDCKSVFPSAALLRRHSMVHAVEHPFKSTKCNKRFIEVGKLNFHKEFHDNPPYRCDVCKKPFLRPDDIKKHMRTHTREKLYGCGVCLKSFARLVVLQQHERIHHTEKPYVCKICGRRFSHNANKANHVKVHKNETNPHNANKAKHLKIHKEGVNLHTCDLCGRSFTDLEKMNLHRAGHGGEKPRDCKRPHNCAFCQKAFHSRYNLNQHVTVHIGRKPYVC